MRAIPMLTAAIVGIVVCGVVSNAEEAKLDAELVKRTSAAVDRAIDFLRKNQNEDGSFAAAAEGPAITGLVVAGALRTKHVTTNDPMIAKGVAFILKHVQPDGGIYPKGGRKTYSTAVCVMALAAANADKRHQKEIDGAVAFLKLTQWDESEGISTNDARYGGAGYGDNTRPDLSNTTFLLDALKASGLPPEDPAYQRALVFVTRCQNLPGEGANDLPSAELVNDGGFVYAPAESKAGGTPAEGLRSYGSMTYAGLKSFIYAGLKKDDRRVKAATDWIKKNYTLKLNPGMDQQGLYYYYHTFAKALDAVGIDVLEDAKGIKHEWREELLRELVSRQRPDGSWLNDNQRWFEGNAPLVTGYVLLAIAETLE